MTREEIIKRRHDIYDLREKGMSFNEIGDIYGISSERVRQLYIKEVRIINGAKWGYYK